MNSKFASLKMQVTLQQTNSKAPSIRFMEGLTFEFLPCTKGRGEGYERLPTNLSRRSAGGGSVIRMTLFIAIVATLLALVQNLIMFAAGGKEGAFGSSPLFFLRFFLLEIALIWVAFFCVRKLVRQKRELVLAGCAILILGAAEIALPASFFTIMIQHAERKLVLSRIQHVGTSIEPLSSDDGGTRFALTYTLKFPKTRPYLTYPADLGWEQNQVFGYYFHKSHPEYDDENYVYEAGKPYSFTVVFDTDGKKFDFSKEKASIDICDSKDYFMACRMINIGLEGVPAALANPAPPDRLEPEVPADNIPDLTEKSIRLAGLVLSPTYKSGEPVAVEYEITNTGKREISIPGGQFAYLISVNYAWEAVSESAKKTKVVPGTWRYGDAVTAGTNQFVSIRKSSLAPGESVAIHDVARPFEPLAPGEYRLHVFLFSYYATYPNKPEQDLVQAFSVKP